MGTYDMVNSYLVMKWTVCSPLVWVVVTFIMDVLQMDYHPFPNEC